MKDKVIWITGASSGIGEALAYELASQGTKLILSARRKEELERVRSACKGTAQENIQLLPFDLAEASTLELTTKAAVQLFGHIDVLVNNGGISQRSAAKDSNMEVYRKLMEVDFFGTIAISRHLLDHFLERKSGHFVTITSVNGKLGAPNRTGYAAAKHALHGFFDSLRAELWSVCPGIHISLICPGWINTNLSIHALTADGSPQKAKDQTHIKGMKPEVLAKKIAGVIRSKKEEAYFGGFQEVLAIYLKRYVPGIFSKIIRNVKIK